MPNLVKQRKSGTFNLKAFSDIAKLESAMKALPQEMHIKEELFHHFAEGLYAREMRVPAGSLIVGKMHRYPCLNFVMTGEVEVRSAAGAKRYKAPAIFESGAGTKRAMYAVTDLTWVTVHPISETDLERIEDQLIDDHAAFLHEFGLSEELAQKVCDIPWITLDESYCLSGSPIHGIGVFSMMKKGDRLTALKDGKKTQVGRYTNHSSFPNVSVVREGESVYFQAETDIDGEVKVNYRNVLGVML